MLRALGPALAGLVGLVGVASAADLPSRRAPEPEVPFVPRFAWTGFYLGANAGYGVSLNRHTTLCAPALAAGCTALPDLDTNGDGVVAGGQVGYNQQIGRFLAGLEGDAQYTDIGRTRRLSGVFPDGVGGFVATTYGARQRLDYLGTVRARVGYVMDRVLVFTTGGLAYGDVSVGQSVALPATISNAARSETQFGYAVGGGVEYGFAPNLTGKVEALYYDLGRTRVAAPALPGGAITRGARFETRGVVARAGLNYKLDLF
jgi:outer membrane immunogenic protein